MDCKHFLQADAGRTRPVTNAITGTDGLLVRSGRTANAATPSARWRNTRLPANAGYELSAAAAGTAGSPGVSSR
jgi:hypothetical protein